MFVKVSYVGAYPPYFIIENNDHGDHQPLAAEWRKCIIEYLDEGGANFIFTLRPASDPLDLPSRLRGKLLRLPKSLPHVLPADEQLQTFRRNFGNLFPVEHIITAELVRVDHSVVAALNDGLARMQPSTRPLHRLTDLLPDSDMAGQLITDMTTAPGQTLVQLKPKWLHQSPNAPTNSRRCRTCALRAHRAAKRERTASDAQEICPLALIHGDVRIRRRAFAQITADRKLREYLAVDAQPLLLELRECQVDFDEAGVLGVEGETAIKSLCKAMTLRDCTLYVRRNGEQGSDDGSDDENYAAGGSKRADDGVEGGTSEGDSTIEARLGDLDLKLPGRLDYWKRTEQDLVDGGWYTNEEDAALRTSETICTLSVDGL
jgi:inositol-pentakisphosphate 2-kinase